MAKSITNSKNVVADSIIIADSVEIGDKTSQYLSPSTPNLTQEWFTKHAANAVANLHDRYSPKEHFDLPAAQLFSGLARDGAFQAYTKECFHLFLKTVQEKIDSLQNSKVENTFLGLVEQLRADVRTFYHTIQWSAGVDLNLSPCIVLVKRLREETEKKRSEFREKRHQEIEKRRGQKREYHTEPFDSELHYLWELYNTASEFSDTLEDKIFQLATNPCLLITGAGGNGKSHLLGDTASKKVDKNQPVVLILGNQIKTGADFWLQMLSTIELHCGGDAFLQQLNDAGRQAGVRALLMIDALNEGEGKQIWKHHIAGFVEQVGRYPYIGLVLTVRSTFLDIIVPKTLLNNSKIVRFEHQGFMGYELEAIKHFCHLFELEQPRFPVLSPEFSNPLLLLLLCKTLKKNEQNALPAGMNGITTIYEAYLEAVNERMAEKFDYPEQKNWVRKGLEKLGDALAQSGNQHLDFEKASQIFRELSPEFGAKLFDELTFRESILTEDRIVVNYKTDEGVDVIRFGYERFGDYLVARRLLNLHVQKHNVTAAFQKDGFFDGFFAPKKLYRNKGILEAVAVLLPELYGVEIVEIFPESSLKSGGHHLGYQVVESWIMGLFWRKKESIDRERITNLFRKWVRHGRIIRGLGYMRLSLAIIPNHPLNADWLHASLERLSMPERDRVWSTFLNEVMSDDESGIKRVIDWIWREEELEKLSEDVVQLAAVLLGWCFTSSNVRLRDLSTLTVVRLLDERPVALLNWMQKFELVDDMYVQERVFAVALGVSLRMESQQGILNVAQYIYDRIFSKGEPPVHVLLRDYARTTVEYALHLQLLINLDVQKIRSPYGSALPDCPSKTDIKKYKIKYDSEAFAKSKEGFSAQGSIVYSVLMGDFNRYVIEAAVSNFETVSFTAKLKTDAFMQGSDKRLRRLIKLHEKEHELVDMPKGDLDHEPIARWILQRVFELGWSRELHGSFDYNIRGQEEVLKTERIGKKYQWIAFHEAIARIVDNHYISEHGEKPYLYEGTFSPFLRTIDPTYPHVNSAYHPVKKPCLMPPWCKPISLGDWHDPNWINLKDDLPDPIKLTQFMDEKGQDWIAIVNFPEWRSNEDFGEKDSRNQRIWYQIRAYFIQQKDEEKAVKWFSKQNFMDRWMPEHRGYYELFDREMFWSHAQRYFDTRARQDGFKLWQKPNKFGSFNVMVPAEEYEAGGGSFELQKGRFLKPSAYLWEKMALKYGKKLGQVFDSQNRLAFQDFSTISDKQHILLANKDVLLEFLKDNELSIIWTVLGEKQLFGGISTFSINDVRKINGLMYLNRAGKIETIGLRCEPRND